MRALRKWLLVLLTASAWARVSADEAPVLTSDPEDAIVAFGSDRPIIFTATGGSTSEPPDALGTAPWTRTGRRVYTWSIKDADAESGAKPISHPLDGIVTEKNILEFLPDTAGSFTIEVRLQEEWEDSSAPSRTVLWPADQADETEQP